MNNQETEEARLKRWDQWFVNVRKEFGSVFSRFAGKPVTYVEIGCWAGASGEWMAQHVLTHPDSLAVGIDPYPVERRHPREEIDAIRARARSRIAKHVGERWVWLQEPSQTGLCHVQDVLNERSIDLLYIDGAHAAHNMLVDFAMAWPHLRVGSVVVFDDWLPYKELPRSVNRGGTGAPHVVTGYRCIREAWGNMLVDALPEAQHRRQRSVEVVSKQHTPMP